MRPDDDINIAGLVLERYKYRSRGGARALATGDDARRPRRSAAGKQFQFIGGGKTPAREGRPQQREREASPSETGARAGRPESLSPTWRRHNPPRFPNPATPPEVAARLHSRHMP